MSCRPLHIDRPFLYQARHDVELVGCPSAELCEVEVLAVAWSAEGGIDGAVVASVDVDEVAHIDVGCAGGRFLLRGILEEGVVLVVVACDDSAEHLAHGQSSWLTGEELEVDAELGVGTGHEPGLVVLVVGLVVIARLFCHSLAQGVG